MELLSDVVIIRNATTTTKMGGYETRDFFLFLFLRTFHNKDSYNIITVNVSSADCIA